MQVYLTVGVRETERSTVLYVDGELDLASARQLEEAISRARRSAPELVVLDLEKLEFIDMAGLRVLTSAHQLATQEGQGLVLANVPDQIRRVLVLAEADELLPDG